MSKMSTLVREHSCSLLDEIQPDGDMEHSYSRDNNRPEGNPQMGGTRTIMVHRPPQCPSCHIHTDEGIDVDEPYNPPLPKYDEENAKIAMEDTAKVTKCSKNVNLEEVDWEEKFKNQYTWTPAQVKLFERIAKILDGDRLARLAAVDRPHEPVQRRAVIDKSVDRFRKAFGNVSWDPKLTQWIHNLMLDNLPPSYLAAYLDILQTLRAKVPMLVDKMLYARPGLVNPDLLAPVLKDVWEPVVEHKNRKLPGQPFIVVVPSGPNVSKTNTRIKKWYSLFSTMASVVPIQSQVGCTILNKQSLQTVTEHMVAVTRAKMLEIRNDSPNRPIILVGFNAGASLAIQVGLVENVSCIVCIGFAYNTVFGERGAPDDHILDVTTPIQFVVGQNAARSSPEEIEHLRQNMLAQTSLVVVGSADDSLRVCKTKRKIEGVTQSMVDNMVMDEIAEFATTCLVSPPEPKSVKKSDDRVISPGQATGQLHVVKKINFPNYLSSHQIVRKRRLSSEGDGTPRPHDKKQVGRPRKNTVFGDKPKKDANSTPKKVGRPRTIPRDQEDTESDVSPAKIYKKEEKSTTGLQTILTSYEVPTKTENTTTAKSVMVTGSGKTPIILPLIDKKLGSSGTPIAPSSVVLPGNQFIQLKPSTNSGTQKVYTLKTSPKSRVPTTIVQKPTTAGTVTTTKTMYKPVSGVPTTKLMTIVTSKGQVAKQSSQLQLQRLSAGQQPMTKTFSPTKYTILKQNVTTSSATATTSTTDLSSADIFDMPIVFADNDGVIQDKAAPILVTQPQQQQLPKLVTLQTTSKVSTLPVSSGNRNIVIQGNSLLANKIVTSGKPGGTTSKILFINKSSLPKGGVITAGKLPANVKLIMTSNTSIGGKTTFTTTGGNLLTLQNAGIVGGNTTTGGTELRKLQTTSGAQSIIYRQAGVPVTKNVCSLVGGNKLEILNSSVIKPATKSTVVTNASSGSPTIHQNTIIVKTANPQFKQLTVAKPLVVKSGTSILQVQQQRKSAPATVVVTTTTAPTTGVGAAQLQIAPSKAFGSVQASQMVQKQLQQQQVKRYSNPKE